MFIYRLIWCGQQGISVVGASHRTTWVVVLVYHMVMYTKSESIRNNRSFHTELNKQLVKNLSLSKSDWISIWCAQPAASSQHRDRFELDGRYLTTLWHPERQIKAAVCQALCLSTTLASSLNQSTYLNPPAQIWGSIKFGVRSLALWCHCHPPMRTPLLCNFHCGLPNIKLAYTPMSSENTH